MMQRLGWTVFGLSFLAVSVLAPDASAQFIDGRNTALENASSGAVAARTPGRMVSAGLLQAQAFANAGRAGVEITETSRPTSVRAQAIADATALIFEQLNQAIVLFHNLLLARAGRPPIIPMSILGSSSGTGGLSLGGLDLGSLLDAFGGR